MKDPVSRQQEDAILYRRHERLAAEYDRLIKLFKTNGFVFGLTINSDTFMKAALETDAETDSAIAAELVRQQYPFIAEHPHLIKSVTVMDDEQCLVVEKYGKSKPDVKRVAYITLDPEFLDISAAKDGKLSRPTMKITAKDDPESGFYAVRPTGNHVRRAGTRDFIMAYDSFGGFLRGSTTIENGFCMLFAASVGTFRSVVASSIKNRKK